jgi:hypothetical protein
LFAVLLYYIVSHCVIAENQTKISWSHDITGDIHFMRMGTQSSDSLNLNCTLEWEDRKKKQNNRIKIICP